MIPLVEEAHIEHDDYDVERKPHRNEPRCDVAQCHNTSLWLFLTIDASGGSSLCNRSGHANVKQSNLRILARVLYL